LNVQQIVEAVLFASDAPLTAGEIARADESLDEDQVEAALDLLKAEYDDAGRSFQIVELAEGHQILTRAEFAPYLERFDNVPRPSRLSGPSLETLAIIAYRQPIGRLEIEYIRGVGASGVIRTLQERNLVDVVGRSEGIGRPLLYGTTRHFLEHFGFRSLEDLPRPEELPILLRDRIPLGVDGDGDDMLPRDPAQVSLELGARIRNEHDEEDFDTPPDARFEAQFEEEDDSDPVR
jgi:segregation and condensation protein B